ncbi:MAG: hypothetical protein ACRDKV_01965 [Solirubrobacterales bacterium]
MGRATGRAREIGPIGTASRVAGGLLAIALPVALEGIGWWDVAVALIALPVVATVGGWAVIAGYRRFSPESLERRHAICSGPACLLWAIVIAAGIGLAALTPAGEVAIWSWVGASLLIAAARGSGGCEVLAFPNAITGRRYQVGCMLYTPIDNLEARRQAKSMRWEAQ